MLKIALRGIVFLLGTNVIFQIKRRRHNFPHDTETSRTWNYKKKVFYGNVTLKKVLHVLDNHICMCNNLWFSNFCSTYL